MRVVIRRFAHRLAHFGTFVEALSSLFIALAIGAWFAYFLTGILGIFLGHPSSNVQAMLSLAAGIAALWWTWYRRRSSLRQRWKRSFSNLDRSSPDALLQAVHHLEYHALHMGELFVVEARGDLLRAWATTTLDLNPSQQEVLLRLLLSSNSPGNAQERERVLFLLSSQVKGAQAWHLLEAWNRQEASGGQFPEILTEGLLSRLHGDEITGNRAEGLPLLYRFAREGNEEARSLLQSCVRLGHLRAKTLPPDLRSLLFASDFPPGGLDEKSPIPATQRAEDLLGFFKAGLRVLIDLGRSGWTLVLSQKTSLPHLQKGAIAIGLSLVLVFIYVSLEDFTSAPQQHDEGMLLFPAMEIESGFTIQTMATRDSLLAVERTKELSALGYWAYYLSPREGRKWYRVRLGHFEYRAEADSLATQLKESQLIEDYYLANFQRNEPRHEPQ